MGVPGVGAGVVECESCHGTQSTYHAKCSRECSSGPGRPSIPGKLIVINQVTEAEQGLADDYLSPLLLLLPPSLLLLLLPLLWFFLRLLPPSYTLFFLMQFSSRVKKEKRKRKTVSKQFKETTPWDVNASTTHGGRCERFAAPDTKLLCFFCCCCCFF